PGRRADHTCSVDPPAVAPSEPPKPLHACILLRVSRVQAAFPGDYARQPRPSFVLPPHLGRKVLSGTSDRTGEIERPWTYRDVEGIEFDESDLEGMSAISGCKLR